MKQRMDRAEGYTADEVSMLTGVKPSTVRYWAKDRGNVIRAGVKDSRLRGSRKLFSGANLVQVRIAYLLMQEGWPQQEVARELRQIFRQKGDKLDPAATTAGLPAWLLFVDRHMADWNRRWTFKGVWSPGKPLDVSGFALSRVLRDLYDAEVVTISWPDGFTGQLGEERTVLKDLNELKGVKRLSVINLRVIKQRINNQE